MGFKRFINFLKNNVYLVIAILVIIILAFGYALITIDDISVDEEIYFQGSSAAHAQNWIGFSRYGMALLNLVLFPVLDAIPFLNGILSVLLLGATAALLCWLIHDLLAPHKAPKIAYVFLATAVIAYPSNLDYFSFNSINAAVSVGLLTSVLSVFLITQWIFEKRPIGEMLLGILLAAFVFSLYQAFVGVYLTLAVLFSFIYILKNSFDGVRVKARFILFAVLIHAALLAAALGIFYLGDFLVRAVSGIGSNGYTEGLFQASSPLRMLLNLKYNLEIYFTGHIADGGVISYTAALFILSVILYLFGRESKNRLLLALLAVALIFAPFTLGVIWAGVTPRVLTALPMLMGFTGFLSVLLITRLVSQWFNKRIRLQKLVLGVLTLLVIISGYMFIYYDNLSAYASHVRYVRDESFARMLAEKIIDEVKTDAPEQPIVLLGNYDIKEMENGNTVGYSGSLFHYDNTHFRGAYFMDYLGFKFIPPSWDDLAAAKELAANMPVWPAEGCILETEDLIIVRLSEAY